MHPPSDESNAPNSAPFADSNDDELSASSDSDDYSSSCGSDAASADDQQFDDDGGDDVEDDEETGAGLLRLRAGRERELVARAAERANATKLASKFVRVIEGVPFHKATAPAKKDLPPWFRAGKPATNKEAQQRLSNMSDDLKKRKDLP